MLELPFRIGEHAREVTAMYGMVNQAIVEYLGDEFGSEILYAVLEQSGCQETQFSGMTQYPDETSYALVGAAADATGRPAEDILGKIGEYWVGFALRSDYGDLLRMAGNDLPNLLQNLDHLHARVGEAFDDLRPPSFWCDELTEDSLVLHYASERPGLEPMVAGIVRGLGHLVETNTTVSWEAAQAGDSCAFQVQFVAQASARSAGTPIPTTADGSGAP